MTWEEHYHLYREAHGRRGNEAYQHLQSARKRVAQNSPEDWQWLITSLDDNERKWFVAEVFRFQQLPKRLFIPMLRAGVLERNPSLNGKFIDPCVRCFGAVRVCTELLTYLETGGNEEKAGAASALYWAWRPKPSEDMSELRYRIQADMLQEFIYNEDLQVRRRIIPRLELKPEYYPEELHPLIQRAIEIARAHPDEYIRHRVEIQLGGGGPYLAIPDTE
jgi:hypothetical protein